MSGVPARGEGQAVVVPRGFADPVDRRAQRQEDRGRQGFERARPLVAATESAGLAWSDFTPVYLAPADAASAFSRGGVDAWSIWDPFFAIAELKQNARPLPVDPRRQPQNSFFLANSDFLAAQRGCRHRNQ